MSQLFQNVLTASLHGGIVIAVVILLRLVLKKAPKKFICLLWLLAGVRLLMPFEIQSNLSLQPEISTVTEVQRQEPQMDYPLMWDSAESGILVDAAAQDEVPVHNQATVRAAESAKSETPSVDTAVPAEPEREPFDWKAAISWAWLAVACCFGVYTLICYLRLKWQVRESIQIPGGWECDRIETAFILGFIRPRIYIPMGMSENTRRYILAHERTHLEKGDHWFKMIGFLALAIHWFNPLVWVAYILLCKDIEMACDERVVQFMELEERKEYSVALLNCSTNRAHFAACPVAFGEVSVKERIQSVLNYRKPGFWISLLSVIAIVFVAICLLTSPAGDNEAAGETISTEATEENGTGFAASLTEDDIAFACQTAIDRLKNAESYCILSETIQQSKSVFEASSEIRRSGNNSMTLVHDAAVDSLVNSSMYYENQNYEHYGDAWVIQEFAQPIDPNAWLDKYSPEGEGKEIYFPEGTGVLDENTVAFAADVKDSYFPYNEYDALFYYTFTPDGDAATIRREMVCTTDEGDEIRYINTLTVMEEDPGVTAAKIKEQADQAITTEELEEYRLQQELVTEVPSNKTSYDKDFMLGSGTMGWKFMEGQWFFKFGAENVTPTSAKLVVEFSGPYGEESTLTGGTVEAGAAYFLEELVNDEWVEVPIVAENFTSIQPKVLSAGGTQTINWENNYGKLPAGFYRIGNYYVFTSDTGETDVQACYAKFRIYDENHEKLLQTCRDAIEELKNRDSYHLYSFNWMTQLNYDYYLSSEVWKSGRDYLEVTRYPSRSNIEQMLNVRGSMWRDGKYYGLTWGEDPVVSTVSEWWKSVDGYMDDSNFDMWSWDFDWYDAYVELVYQEGSDIHILQTYDYSDQYECTEIVVTLDDAGKITNLAKYYLPTRTCSDREKVAEVELVVYDTGKDEITQLIGSQDVSTPMPFDYAEDVKNNPDAKTEGFKNTTAKTIKTAEDAIARADKESTMPALMEFKSGYCQTMVWHDEEAGIWKVKMFWWQHDTAQTVYMDDQGITQMIVSVE